MGGQPESTDEDYWTLGEFMEEHYSKFAIMGIFGTVSVFLSGNFPGDTSSIITRTGMFASMVVFGIAALWIFVHASGIVFNELNDTNRPLSTELGFVTLAICTGALVFSLGVAISNFQEITSVALQIAVVISGVLIYLRVYPSDVVG